MSLFSSDREKRLWVWTLVVVVAIYATLSLTPILAKVLRDQGLISNGFWIGMLLIGAAVLVMGLKARPSGVEIGIALGIAGAYLIAFMRMANPLERSHMIEYSVVALLIYEALKERVNQGRNVPAPALLSILATTVVGLIDECIQIFIPSRVFDLFDVGFNALAAVMAVTGSAALTWSRTRWGRGTQ